MCKCDFLFSDLKWRDLTTAVLPPQPGIYAIQVREKGKSIDWTVSNVECFLEKIRWRSLRQYVLNRMDRLRRIDDCPIIYIGSTSSLQGRYEDLGGKRHTAFFSILALLVARWNLEIGWLSRREYGNEEDRLKTEYVKLHGKLPALVER